MYRQFAKKYILGCSLKKKRSSLRFHLWFPYFPPKIRMFSKKKKGSSLQFHLWCSLKKKDLHFDFISDFPISIPKSGCSLYILAQEFQVQNSSNKATPQNIQATPFGVATYSLTNTDIYYIICDTTKAVVKSENQTSCHFIEKSFSKIKLFLSVRLLFSWLRAILSFTFVFATARF